MSDRLILILVFCYLADIQLESISVDTGLLALQRRSILLSNKVLSALYLKDISRPHTSLGMESLRLLSKEAEACKLSESKSLRDSMITALVEVH